MPIELHLGNSTPVLTSDRIIIQFHVRRERSSRVILFAVYLILRNEQIAQTSVPAGEAATRNVEESHLTGGGFFFSFQIRRFSLRIEESYNFSCLVFLN